MILITVRKYCSGIKLTKMYVYSDVWLYECLGHNYCPFHPFMMANIKSTLLRKPYGVYLSDEAVTQTTACLLYKVSDLYVGASSHIGAGK